MHNASASVNSFFNINHKVWLIANSHTGSALDSESYDVDNKLLKKRWPSSNMADAHRACRATGLTRRREEMSSGTCNWRRSFSCRRSWSPANTLQLAQHNACTSTSTIATVTITQPLGWYSFYRPIEGGRLSRPRHCSKGVQPVPKAVYRSGCCDKAVAFTTKRNGSQFCLYNKRVSFVYIITGFLRLVEIQEVLEINLNLNKGQKQCR